MNQFDVLNDVVLKTDSKIVLLVVDGLGGIQVNGKTELEVARTPTLDLVAEKGSCGLLTPVFPGIFPGSGPAHMALFGYDPLEYFIGRGVLAALGSGFDLKEGDVAARVNFCTLENGVVTDRRAGRIPGEKCAALCEKIRAKITRIEDIDVFIQPVKQYRAVVVFRGPGLGGNVKDTDPMKENLAPLPAAGEDVSSEKTARIANAFIEQVAEMLRDERPANMVNLRGFSLYEQVPQFADVYKLNPAAIASYPLYKGVSTLVGMEQLPNDGTYDDEIACLQRNYDKYDFFYIHMKEPDAAGEDGNFDERVRLLEYFDEKLKDVLVLKPDVLIITGDHCTPAKLKDHSWHQVPLVILASSCRVDNVRAFTEEACMHGSIGQMESKYLMSVALAHAGKMKRFGP